MLTETASPPRFRPDIPPPTRILRVLTTSQFTADETIRETARQVYRSAEYNRFSIWERLWGFASDLFSRTIARVVSALESVVPRTGLGSTMLIILLVLLVTLAVWIAVLWWRRRDARRRVERRQMRRDATATLRSAEELASRGLFTDAAHALYAALLVTVSQRGHIRLHHSKTIGDYVRELRRRTPSLFARFREFSRTYELVIYGLGECDRERYERLLALALPIVQLAGESGP